MGIYIGILITIILFGIVLKPNKNNKNKKIYIFLIFTMLTIVSAIRNYTVGVDTEQFCVAFDRIASHSWSDIFQERYEMGFIIFCKILSYISTNSQILIIASSIIIFPLIGMFIYRNSKDVVISSILYITLNTYAMQMNVMRQAIAIAIIVLAYDLFFKREKFIKYAIMVVIASLFHQTALIMIPLIAILNRKYTTKTYIITNLVAIITFLLANKIWGIAVSLFPTYAGYVEKEKYMETSYFAGTISATIAWLVLTIGIFFERKNKEKTKEYHFLAYIMSILVITDILVIKINLFVRLATYFGIFTCIWLPNTLQNIKIPSERILMKYIVIICFILYWLILSIYRPEWYGVIPYSIFTA